VAAARAIVKRWLNGALARGWTSWAAMVAERHEALRKLRSGAAKMLNRRLALGLQGWLEATRTANRAAAEARRKLLGAAKAFSTNSVRRAFNSWSGCIKGLSEIESRACAAASLLCCGARRALRTWALHRPALKGPSRRTGLILMRASQSLMLADNVLRSFFHWRVGATIRRVQQLSRSLISAEREAAESKTLQAKLVMIANAAKGAQEIAEGEIQHARSQIEAERRALQEEKEAEVARVTAQLERLEEEAEAARTAADAEATRLWGLEEEAEAARTAADAEATRLWGREQIAKEQLQAVTLELEAKSGALTLAEAHKVTQIAARENAEARLAEMQTELQRREQWADERVSAAQEAADEARRVCDQLLREGDERLRAAESRAAEVEAERMKAETIVIELNRHEEWRSRTDAERGRAMEAKLDAQTAQMQEEMAKMANELVSSRKAEANASYREAAAAARTVQMEREVARLSHELQVRMRRDEALGDIGRVQFDAHAGILQRARAAGWLRSELDPSHSSSSPASPAQGDSPSEAFANSNGNGTANGGPSWLSWRGTGRGLM
jgi:hypothetical protein